MKKIIALMLSLLITISVGIPTASASYSEDDSVIVDPTATTPLYAHDIETTIPMSADHGDSICFDLAGGPVATSSAESQDIPALDISTYQNLDISKAINVTSDLLHLSLIHI